MASSSPPAVAMAIQQNRRNAVRFNLLEDLEMDRLQFSRQILQKDLQFSTNELDYVFAFPGKKIYEVVFTTVQNFDLCMQRFDEKKRSAPSFKKITMIPLAERDVKTVHVIILSEKVRNQDVWTWLSRFCDVTNGMEVTDIDGVKTGTRRFQVRLRRAEGAVQHIPNTIQLGAFRGSAFYPGQPKQCRRCGSLDHLAASCPSNNCKRCKASDHNTDQCTTPLECSLCSSTSHRFRDCPKAYSNRVKLNTITNNLPMNQGLNEDQPLHQVLLVPQEPDAAPDNGPILDWAADPIPDDNVGSTAIDATLAPAIDHRPAQQAESTPRPEQGIQRRKSPATLQEAGDMLESLLANLPDITDPEMPAERGNLLLEALETPPAIPLFESPPDQSAHSKKRQMNSSSSGEPSLLMIPTYPGTKWSSSLGKNPSFLEDEQVEAFTAVTHIRETHKPEPLARPKRPKKIRKDQI